ncbi:MAG TPA: hypothetical protein VLS89_06820 [Candidatus Nanopelagicales bacterium]|nr:hypothetical protein [Candidatus Nanopelagicales bacterium]
MSTRDVWQQIFQRFDPEQPPPPEWRADRERSPVQDITQALDRPFGEPRALLLGTIGTGKTTELLRIAEARAAIGQEFVVFIDLVRHFGTVVGDVEALQHVSAWEVCFLAGLALIRAAEERLGYKLRDELVQGLAEAWKAAAKATRTTATEPQLDITGLAKSMVLLASTAAAPQAAPVAAGLKVLEGALGSVRWNVGIGRSERSLPDQDEVMQGLLGSVNLIVGTFQQWHRRVLFVIDGLDRILSLDRARALFLESEMVGRLACPLVVSGPFALRHHKAVSAIRRFSTVCTLVNEPVLREEDPAQHGPGVSFLCEVYRKRIQGLSRDELIPVSLLEQLAYYSGGRVREFVKLISMVAERAWDADLPQATEAVVQRVLDEARRLAETGIDSGDVEILERIARDPKHELPAGDKARELLTYARLLPYPNESEWYYPHPLLTIHKVRAKPVGSSG